MDVKRVSYGSGARNPLEKVSFFENKSDKTREGASGGGGDHLALGGGGGEPTPLVAGISSMAARHAALPRSFQEVTLRVFLVDDSKQALDTARRLLKVPCHQHLRLS